MPLNVILTSRVSGAISRIRSLRCRFVRDEQGTIAVIFAILFAFMFSIVAITVDFGLMSVAKVRQQKALDAATLAAADRLGLPDQDVSGPAIAQAYYDANTKRTKGNGTLSDVTLDPNTGRVAAIAGTDIFSTLLKGIGIKKTPVGGKSLVMKGQSSVEVALVLDNSGSMSPEIGNLKVAAKNLAGVLFAGLEGTERMRIGLVPFAASVNVGAQYATASWIDSSGLAPTHYENFDSPRTRFQLFADMGQSWKGCVESRPAPYDVNVAPPDASNPATLFVPMFAPDEPDDVNSAGNSYHNNYLVDDGGTCTPQETICLYYNSFRGRCTKWEKAAITPETAQARVCKYSGQSPSGGRGPNKNCTTAPILPLTSTKTQVFDAIDSMVANGYTNILEGTMWGWRLLSSAPPFTEGRAAGNGNRKYLVIMTDGENTYQSRLNHNSSMYGSFGFKSKGRIGVSTSMAGEIDAKTIAACENAKADGIVIYTIAFRDAVTSSSARTVLNACSSGSSRALTAADGAALGKAFEEIGRQISQLRVTG
jgi:Flp pilus assembly protein TadG